MLRRILLLLMILGLITGVASARDDDETYYESDIHGGADGDPGEGDFSPKFIEVKFVTEMKLIIVKTGSQFALVAIPDFEEVCCFVPGRMGPAE